MKRLAHTHLAGSVVLFLLAATTIPSTTVAVVSLDGEALLAWKASLSDPAALSNWTRAKPMCLSWDGLYCHLERVVKLRLSGLGLSGGLDTLDTSELQDLVTLDLSGNNLGGAIPAGISRLRSLELLDLSSNRFDSSIPPGLGGMPNLVFLQLYNNSLVGGIPPQLCRLPLVRLLDISKNESFRAACKIPMAVPSQTCSLRWLYLARNSFIGAFPPVLRSCNSLETVDIGNNGFFGVIPPWIWSRFPLLKILSLRSNNFTGEIPPQLSRHLGLQLLDMANNSLTGSIPVSFGSFFFMKYPQNLSATGSLHWTKYDDKINIIWKGQEQIFQSATQSLAGIDLSGNLLSRCIPKELTNLLGIQFLNLSRNHLSCGIPKDIGSLTYLESLDLSSNELLGGIPPSMSNLSWLNTFNVSNNLLSGKIPAGSQMQTLTDPSIYSNNSRLCGFPLETPCPNTFLTQNERNGGNEDQWLYYWVIAGIVFGFWLWFGMLFIVKTWRCAFLLFVDGMQCKVMKKA
ncbi:receptor-like protein EIX2 [Aegilops tauschii subsp. strangulata]|uniref:Putative LRR receptor-like serine/threonine-protein kinase n=1 Tax=Aegilops tauschii TaxID=37682 RepID=M8B0F8_AEGTA